MHANPLSQRRTALEFLVWSLAMACGSMCTSSCETAPDARPSPEQAQASELAALRAGVPGTLGCNTADERALRRVALGGEDALWLVPCGSGARAQLLVRVHGSAVDPITLPGELTEHTGDAWQSAITEQVSARRAGDVTTLRVGAVDLAAEGGRYAALHWTGRTFALDELRRREAGDLPVDPGPWPIVAPPERRCSVAFAGVSARSATLVALGPNGAEARLPFALIDDGCEQVSTQLLDCASGAEYAVVARAGDWVVMRLSPSESEAVASQPRGCAL